MIGKHPSPRKMQSQTIRIGNVMANCLNTDTKPNYDLIRSFEYTITINEIPPSLGEDSITENYPNYVDFGPDYALHMDNLKQMTFNVINTTALAAKTLAMTTDLGEHNVTSSGKNSATVVAKDKGNRLARTKVQLLGISLHPSMDFARSEHPIDVLMSVWDADMMWWNHNHTRVATPIINIQFWHSMCQKRIKHFKSPASVTFNIKENNTFELELTEDNVVVPRGYRNLSGAALNRHMKIRRVELPRRTVLHVIFYNLSSSVVLDVVVTKQKYPTIEDFAKKTTVRSPDQTILLFANEELYDIWCYVAILPNKIVATGETTIWHFNLSLVISCCVTWNMKRAFWQPACMPGKKTSPTVISCECKHFSVIAGYLQNVPSSLVQNVRTGDILLELQSFYVVLITVAITFGIYCLLLIVVSLKVKEEVYYLADNSREDRYAYLVIVRTENAAGAGTTSAVIIRLIGSKRSSDPHVLNYPDPKMRLLQKQGQDLFVLTTARHLGEIISIELWYDCTGASPSWNCRDILIYDMQTHSEYYFKVKTRFDVDKGVTFLEMRPAGKGQRKLKFSKRFRVCNHFHTWNLLGGEKNIHFQEKLTILLSTMLVMYMFILMCHGVPLMEIKDCLDSYQSYHISWYSVFVTFASSFSSFAIHITVAWLFRFSNIEFVAFNKHYKKSHKMSGLCWVILIMLIVVSLTFLIIFGFWVPFNNSMIWLTCCIIGILLDIIIFENILIMVQTYFCKFRLRYSFEQKFNKFLKIIEEQRLLLYEKFDATIFRPFFHHLYRPLQSADILRRQIIANLRRGIIDDLEDLIMYGIYNVILYMVILVNRGALTLISKAEIESMVQGSHLRTFQFSSVRSTELIFEYINQTLIPAMHPTVWYGNHVVESAGIMVDFANKLIGVARLRQHRIAENTCKVPELMKFLNVSCRSEFSLSDSEVQNFGYGWSTYNSGLEYDRMYDIWRHQSEHETGSLTYMGEFAAYSGGGYVAFLGRTLYNSYVNLLRLYETYWIDDDSRSIFIEFLTYNANYNIFNAVRLLFEQSATGYLYGTMDISAVRMLFVENEIEIMTMVIFVLFMVWVMMLMFKLSIGIYKHIRTFYKRVWLMIDLFINLLSVICIIMFIVRIKMIDQYLQATEAVKHNEFVSYFALFFVEDFLTICAAILICVATARLWRFLRFGLFFRILERTLSMAAFPLVAVTLAFTVILMAFGFSGLLIFGNEFTELSSLVKIIATLIQLTLKPEDYPLMDYSVFSIGFAYFSVYLLLMQVILFIYIVVIIMAYTKAQLEFSVEPESYTVGTYLKEQYNYFPKLMKFKFRRLRAGLDEEEDEDDGKKVKPKADEFRYANCIGIPKSKMKAMRFIISCFIRNMNQTREEQGILTRNEIDLMLGVCYQFVLKTYQNDELGLFFKGHFEGEKKFRLVDEKRIEKMADCVGILLEKSEEEEEEKEEEEPIVDSNTETSSKLIKKQLFMLRSFNLNLKMISCKFDDIEEEFAYLFENFHV